MQACGGTYRPAVSPATQGCSWANHCEHCGSVQEDHDLFCEPEGAFLPVDAASASAIELTRIEEPFAAVAGGYAYDPVPPAHDSDLTDRGHLLLESQELQPLGREQRAERGAYRAGERIRDERSGRIYDHTSRQDVLHKEIVLPSRFADAPMDWARDRASFGMLRRRRRGAKTRAWRANIRSRCRWSSMRINASFWFEDSRRSFRISIDSPWMSRYTLRAIIREAIRAIFTRTCSRPRGKSLPTG